MLSDTEYKKRLAAIWASPRAEKKQASDPRFSETHVGPTPSGGDYSTAYFYDSEHKPCPKDEAKYINIVEFTNDGERVNEHYGIVEE